MKANRSPTKTTYENYCFAVHPLSVEMGREFNHNHVLYFQKDLHIMGRYELTERELGLDKKFYYQLPLSLQTFSIHSENELQFRWSLYMERTFDNYHHEQFMQSKKANLNWCWQILKTHNKNSNTLEAIFKMSKIKFHYIFVIAASQDQVFQEIELYYKENNIIPTKIKKMMDKSSPLRAKQVNKQSEIEIDDVGEISSLQQTSEIKLSTPIGTFGIGNSNNNRSHSQLKEEENQRLSPLKPYLKQKPKYSGSELEAKKHTQSLSKDASNRFLRSQSIGVELGTPIISGIFYNSSQPKESWKESSKIINAKGEVEVSPFYLHFKYWFVIISIIIIFVWLLGQGPKNTKKNKDRMIDSAHSHQKNSQNNKKKASRKKEEKANRKEGLDKEIQRKKRKTDFKSSKPNRK